uniref:C-type lectin domain-containing protein n=1 Tax=Plectus sambesii TaxID=2011161 RepID=A0A914VK93_9BILA
MTTTGAATALTDLQANCTGPDRQYSGTSCYVIVGSSPQKYHPVAKTLCNHYLGYSGHLVHIKNAAVKDVLKQLMTTYNSTAINIAWTGLELLNSSTATNDSNNWGYYYRNGTYFSQTYIPWAATEPRAESNRSRGYYISNTDRMHTTSLDQVAYIACEYEEALKQPVTDLEEKCVNLTSSFKTLFVSDVCYVLNTVNKNYNSAKVACNNLSGYKGHLAHVRTMGELWIAETLRAAANVLYARLGIEQTNTSSTDPYNGWYLTTPTDQPVLTTFLPWATSYPAAGGPTIAMTVGFPNSLITIANTTAYTFICQYDSMTTTTSTTTTSTTSTTTTTTTTTTGTCAPAPAPTTTGSASMFELFL